MAVTTNDCREFLADFFTKNRTLMNALFEGGKDVDIPETRMAKQWKREYKCKAGNNDDNKTEYEIFDLDTICTKYCESHKILPSSMFTVERGFVCCPNKYEDAIKFIVLEDGSGKLYLADYIGD